MICSVRSASCQTVKATAMATVAASAHHGAVAVAGLTRALAGWLALVGLACLASLASLASLALACVAPASVALVSVSVASASPALGSVGLASAALASAALASALDVRVSPKAGQVAGSWRTAK